MANKSTLTVFAVLISFSSQSFAEVIGKFPGSDNYSQANEQSSVTEEEIKKALEKIGAELQDAKNDLMAAKKYEDGRFAVKVRNYTALAAVTVSATGAIQYIWQTKSFRDYPSTEMFALKIALAGVLGVASAGAATYATLTQDEYDEAQEMVEDLSKKAEILQNKLELAKSEK